MTSIHKCIVFHIHIFSSFQAQPLFRDRRKHASIADPLLEGTYPKKGLSQALAVAAMCLREEAEARPVISDVVTALGNLSKKHV